MSAAEIIALIRDIFVILASLVSIVVLLCVGYILLRLYPHIKRTGENVEKSSSVIYKIVAQPLNLAGAIVELVNRILGMVENFKSRERRDENGEVQ